jgi:hypothetical protein
MSLLFVQAVQHLAVQHLKRCGSQKTIRLTKLFLECCVSWLSNERLGFPCVSVHQVVARSVYAFHAQNFNSMIILI